ncbi:MAG: hypothetical protein ACJ77K_19235 [Bacteroidia bacterium]
MKYISIFTLAFLFLISSCKKNESEKPEPVPPPAPAATSVTVQCFKGSAFPSSAEYIHVIGDDGNPYGGGTWNSVATVSGSPCSATGVSYTLPKGQKYHFQFNDSFDTSMITNCGGTITVNADLTVTYFGGSGSTGTIGVNNCSGTYKLVINP